MSCSCSSQLLIIRVFELTCGPMGLLANLAHPCLPDPPKPAQATQLGVAILLKLDIRQRRLCICMSSLQCARLFVVLMYMRFVMICLGVQTECLA